MKTASESYRKNPANTNAIKLKKAQDQLADTYLKEETEYIHNQIDKIRHSVEDRQSRITWQTINEVSRRKSTTKAKLTAANQQERIKLGKQHFENLLGNCDGKFFKIPKRDFIFARVKTGQVGT